MSNPFADIDQRLRSIEETLSKMITLISQDPQPGNTNQVSEDERYDADQLAAYLGCKRDTVLKYKRNKVIPYYQAGRSFYFKRSEVDAYLSSSRHHLLRKPAK